MELTLPQPEFPVFNGDLIEYCDFIRAFENLGSISAVSRVQSLILPEKRRLDACPVDLVCDVIEKLII